MKNCGKLLLLAAGALLFLAPSASADSAAVYIDGSYAFANNGYGIPPYGGTLNGQAAAFYCVDFSHDIAAGFHWTAVTTDLANAANFGATYLNNKNTYLEFAWLIEQTTGTSDLTAKAADQWAIWSLTGGTDPYTGSNSAATLLGLAQAAVNSGYTGAGWEIVTPGTGQYGQEFLVKAPEPSSLLSLGVGLCGLCLCLLKRRQRLGVRAEA